MSTQLPITAEKFLYRTSNDVRFELIRGVAQRTPFHSSLHGQMAMRVGAALFEFVKENQLGAAFASGTGFLIEQDPDTVRAPDAAFVSQDKLDKQPIGQGFRPGAPDLAVEVVSPRDAYVQVEQKVNQWLDAGCQIVWVVNPGQQTVQVYRVKARSATSILRVGDSISGDDLLPGFSLAVAELFS